MVRQFAIAARRPPAIAPLDALLAAALAVAASAVVVAYPPGAGVGPALAGALATTLPLAWRSAAPGVAAVATSWGGLLAGVLVTEDDVSVLVAFSPLIALYTLGERGTAATIAWGLGLSVTAAVGAGLADGDAGSLLFGPSLCVAAVAVGRAVGTLDFQTDVLEAQVDTLRHEQDTHARAAVAEERARIARELHDVIGHSISVMGIQAGAVRRVLPAHLADERELLLSVERTGRDSVTEMRRLIDLLRTDDVVPGAAVPTLGRASMLVEEMRHAGLHVTLDVAGDIGALPPGRGIAAYRILQEALVNALKHAPGAPVQVRLQRSASAVEIEVTNGPDPAAARVTGGGHGIIGMRERAAMYGGTLDAAPTPGGGFRVVARLPVEAA